MSHYTITLKKITHSTQKYHLNSVLRKFPYLQPNGSWFLYPGLALSLRVRSLSCLILKTNSINGSMPNNFLSQKKPPSFHHLWKLAFCLFFVPSNSLPCLYSCCKLPVSAGSFVPCLLQLMLRWVFWWLSSAALKQELISHYLLRVPPNQQWMQHYRG